MLDQILSYDFADRVVHAHDASLYRMLPTVVARPKSETDIIDLISWARMRRTGLTFRAGGTSLSGQAVTHGALVLLGREWNGMRIEHGGELLTCGPAVRGGVVNSALAKFNRRIGPDPASIQAACLGGIVANNASGMCCGVEENSYQTLQGLKLILASGLVVDTRESHCDELLREKAPTIYSGLLSLREKVLHSPRLVELIRRKSSGKNTTGYGLQAFLDYSRVSEILAHLMVGSEGTLGFISEITLRTVPLRPHRASALLAFGTMDDACELTPELRSAGCSAIELLDFASIQTLLEKRGVPSFLSDLKQDSACLLVQIQKEDVHDLSRAIESNHKLSAHSSVIFKTDFFSDKHQQDLLWNLRKGIFPAVGARRKSGTSVIIEDVAFPLERLAAGTRDLRKLLNFHLYNDAVIYGHARDGNLHFVLAQDFSSASEIKRYERFIDEMVERVAVVHGGALKAEHGTGRNMAPFVEKEWGEEAYALMWELKRILDPENVFNPGVILNSNKLIHLENLKEIPHVAEGINTCIECGFCEPVCPSQGLTLSPRGRIVLERERVINSSDKHFIDISDVKHALIETCAADGLCARACPVGINTGEWVKQMRLQNASTFQRSLASWTAENTALAESFVTHALSTARIIPKGVGSNLLSKLSRTLNLALGTPVWKEDIIGRKISRASLVENTKPLDVLIFRSCVTRACGESSAQIGVSESHDALIVCSQRANVGFKIIGEPGQCCGQPWSSKGFKQPAGNKLGALIEFLFAESKSGVHPIVIDNSPCASTFVEDVRTLDDDLKLKLQKLQIWDPLDYARFLVQKLRLKPWPEPTNFFPVCSLRKAGKTADFIDLAELLCERPIFPNQEACCGMAGDRGLWHPTLTENAVARLDWNNDSARQGYCSSRTCAVALSQPGVPYGSLFDALEKATRPSAT